MLKQVQLIEMKCNQLQLNSTNSEHFEQMLGICNMNLISLQLDSDIR